MCVVVSDKVALVVGNKDYECERLRGLFYPERDAEEVAKALCELGFKVGLYGYALQLHIIYNDK